MILHWLLIDYCIYRLNVFMISGNGVNPTTGEQWWQWWQHMTVECAYILLFDFQLKAIMRVLDWIYSQSCTRRYDLKSAKRFYEQPVQEPVQGCLWKTVAATCSNNVVSSSCVMLPYPWSSLDVGYWIGCELEEYKLNTYSCALGVPPKTYALDLSFRNVLKVRSQDGHFCRYGQTWSTWINDYRPELPYGLACCRRKKVRWFWDVLRRAVESWTKAEPTRPTIRFLSHLSRFLKTQVGSWKRFCRKTCL